MAIPNFGCEKMKYNLKTWTRGVGHGNYPKFRHENTAK